MSEGINEATIMGYLGADPELRFTQGGTAVLNMRVGTTEYIPSKDGKGQEHSEWHNVVVWGARAEALNKFLKKGHQVLVKGPLRTSSYEDKEGTKRWKTEIRGEKIVVGSAPKGDGGERREERDEAPRRERDDDRRRDDRRDDRRRDDRRDERRPSPPAPAAATRRQEDDLPY